MEQDCGTATTEDPRAGTARRVIICGSRTWTDVEAIRALLKTLPPDTVIIHGAAPGADTIAGHEAHALGFEVEAHPADWERRGRAAGPIRNREMLDSGVDRVYAFRTDGRSPGTDNMVRQAAAARVYVEVRHDVPKARKTSPVVRV